LFAPGKASNAGGVGLQVLKCLKTLRLSWSSEEVDEKLKKNLLFTLHVWNMVRILQVMLIT
jgi:glutamate dehydrogenase/leucine dehydrogenase